MNETLGFVGLGRMGLPMMTRLIAAGHSVIAYDASPQARQVAAKAGAEIAGSLRGVADAADIVFLSLPTPDVMTQVVLGADGLSGGAKAALIVDLSTTGPHASRAVAAALQDVGKVLVDCPVSGGVAGAQKGTLALMVAAEEAEFTHLQPLLSLIGRPMHVGQKAGMGQMIKVINNLISATALSISSEAMVLGVKAGLDPDVMIDVFNAGSGRNSATVDKIPNFVLDRSFGFGFALSLTAKDVRLCLEEAESLGVPMLLGSTVREMLGIARQRLGPDADMTEVIRPMEEWAGVTVAGRRHGEASAA